MKNTSIITLGVLFGFCLTAAAQDENKRPGRQGPPPEVVKEFDKDGDGKLSDAERAEMRKVMETRMEERRKEMLEKFDTDKDGKLSPEEREKAREANRAEMLKKFDKDGDGKLSEEERKDMPKPMRRPGGPRGPRGPKGPPPAGE